MRRIGVGLKINWNLRSPVTVDKRTKRSYATVSIDTRAATEFIIFPSRKLATHRPNAAFLV